jgi:uncharacterized membrane protein YedE/YeeE
LETLYKVLLVFCLLFIAAGVMYVLYVLPQVPATPAKEPQSLNGVIEFAGDRLDY